MSERLTQVTIVRDGKDYGGYQPGEIGKVDTSIYDNIWILACPMCGDLGELRNHQVTEHEDGTLSVAPSIVCHGAIYDPPLSVGPSAEPTRKYQPCTAHYFVERNQIRWC